MPDFRIHAMRQNHAHLPDDQDYIDPADLELLELDDLGDEDADAGERDEFPTYHLTEAEEKALAERRARIRGTSDSGEKTIYDSLLDYGLLKKVTDIVMAKVAIPWHLRPDATQEVHAAWATLKANPNVARNQLARYAYISGQHAALKLRRTIGAVVSIPGALFRTGRDTSFMTNIGAAVNPKDVDDYKDSMELSVEPADLLQISRVSESFFDERISGLNLSPKQRRVAYKTLVERKCAEEIAKELEMDTVYVERLINQVTTKLLSKDAEAESPCAKAVPASRKPRAPRSRSKTGASRRRTEK